MENAFLSRLKRGWNVFMNRDPTDYSIIGTGESYYYRPDRTRLRPATERTLISSIYNRIALDVASVDIRHVKLDDNNRFKDEMDSGLNNCFKVEANLDQSGRDFVHDIVMSMFDDGCVAILPVTIDTEAAPELEADYDINTMRTGKVVQWYPYHVKLEVYNELTGKHQNIVVPKTTVAIVQNPFYAVMNEPNSTLQRLVHKMSLLDSIDEQSGAGKLDMIIQLPYVIKSQARREQAEQRRKDIEDQLTGSKYGIAYTDGTERIVQLNRSLDNNLLKQVEYLQENLFSELAISTSILDGSADENTMTNYYNRTVEPILCAITEAMIRVFLSEKARKNKQTIMFFRDPFKLVPVSKVPEIADKLTRNEIMTSNEVRQIIGMKPSDDPNADELRNKNLSQNADVAAEKKKALLSAEENQNGDGKEGDRV